MDFPWPRSSPLPSRGRAVHALVSPSSPPTTDRPSELSQKPGAVTQLTLLSHLLNKHDGTLLHARHQAGQALC